MYTPWGSALERIVGALLSFLICIPFAQATTFKQQIQADLKKSRQVHLSARSYAQWEESTYNTHALSDKWKLNSDQPDFVAALCEIMIQTEPVDLFYFAEYLDSHSGNSECLFQQQLRYRHFLSSEQRKIQARFLDSPVQLGPSEEVYIDPRETPLVIDGHLPDKTVALTVDDGPHHSRTPELLRILAEENVQVNFFLVGENSRQLPDLVKLENAAGHEVGCHSDTHPDMRKLKLEDGVAQIEGGFSAIMRALGVPRTMFRFPYGAFTRGLRNYLRQTETPEFFWNIDTWDWKYPDPSFLINFALDQVRAERRGLILVHDIQPQTIAIMPGFLAALKQEGYKMAVFRTSQTRKAPIGNKF